jgi:hypothetical protein
MSISGFVARVSFGIAALLGTPMFAHAIAVTSTTPSATRTTSQRNASIAIHYRYGARDLVDHLVEAFACGARRADSPRARRHFPTAIRR